MVEWLAVASFPAKLVVERIAVDDCSVPRCRAAVVVERFTVGGIIIARMVGRVAMGEFFTALVVERFAVDDFPP